MFRHLIIIATILFGFSANSQSIEELEREMDYSQGSESHKDLYYARLIHRMEPFHRDAIEVICRYYDRQKKDSVNIFFENLAKRFPDSTEPYLLRLNLIYLQSDKSVTTKLNYLLKAEEIDPKDPPVIYLLAKLYYDDFIFPTRQDPYSLMQIKGSDDESQARIDKANRLAAEERKSRKSNFPNSAEKALLYLGKLWDLEPENHKVLYYPIRQLERHLKMNPDDKYILPVTESYFPNAHFANLTEDWESDLTMDYLFKIRMAEGQSEYTTEQLKSMEEPSLLSPQNGLDIYRFTWLRTFHNPIAVRIEKKKDKIYLYWKVGKGAAGYGAKGLKRKGKRKISIDDWKKFESLVENAKYKELLNDYYVPVTDGAMWTLEHSTTTDYKAKTSNHPGKQFSEACLYLIKLAKIKIKEKDIY